MFSEESGAQGRSDLIEENQGPRGFQPSLLTDDGLPSPAAAVSNLFAMPTAPKRDFSRGIIVDNFAGGGGASTWLAART